MLPMKLAAAIAALWLFLSPAASSQLGDPGYTVDAPAILAVGAPFGFCISSPPGSINVLLVGTMPGNTPTKFGTLGIALPVPFIFIFPMMASGQFCIPPDRNVPCSQSLIGSTLYMQVIAIGPAEGQHGISNRAAIQILDAGACGPPGGLVTYTQGAWGGTCSGTNPACLMQANFASIFPNGLILGDADGIDGDSEFALLLTSSDAVTNFLPEGSTRKPFNQDDVDPTTSEAGVLAGQLVAAKLNLAFDDAGLFDAQKALPAVKLGDLRFFSGIHAQLVGMTVRDLIALTDQVISTAVAMPVDLDGDLSGDVNYSDLSTALDVFNNNFDNGDQNNLHFVLP